MSENKLELICSGHINSNCGNEARELHNCPYQVDINNDLEFLCNCCEDCQHKCIMEI